jgi:hypothetical protein
MKFSLFQQLRKLCRYAKNWPTIGKSKDFGKDMKKKIFQDTRNNQHLTGNELNVAMSKIMKYDKIITRINSNQYAKEVNFKKKSKKKSFLFVFHQINEILFEFVQVMFFEIFITILLL